MLASATAAFAILLSRKELTVYHRFIVPYTDNKRGVLLLQQQGSWHFKAHPHHKRTVRCIRVQLLRFWLRRPPREVGHATFMSAWISFLGTAEIFRSPFLTCRFWH